MKTFVEYLESFRYRQAGGAFGKNTPDAFDFSKKGRSMGGIAQTDNKFQTHKDRVEFGKGKEAIILKALEQFGYQVLPVTAKEDAFQHIDGRIKQGDGPAIPIQVKYRDAGDDLVVEAIKYWTPEMFMKPKLETSDFNGRDMTGIAVYYVGLNLSKDTIRIRRISEAKETAKELVYMLASDFKQSGRKYVQTLKGTARLATDPANQREKVMTYLNPQAFSYKQDLKLKAPLW